MVETEVMTQWVLGWSVLVVIGPGLRPTVDDRPSKIGEPRNSVVTYERSLPIECCDSRSVRYGWEYTGRCIEKGLRELQGTSLWVRRSRVVLQSSSETHRVSRNDTYRVGKRPWCSQTWRWVDDVWKGLCLRKPAYLRRSNIRFVSIKVTSDLEDVPEMTRPGWVLIIKGTVDYLPSLITVRTKHNEILDISGGQLHETRITIFHDGDSLLNRKWKIHYKLFWGLMTRVFRRSGFTVLGFQNVQREGGRSHKELLCISYKREEQVSRLIVLQ